jgi:hypothetical protein
VLVSECNDEDVGVDVIGLELVNAHMSRRKVIDCLGARKKLPSVRLCPSLTVRETTFPVYYGDNVICEIGTSSAIKSTNIYYNLVTGPGAAALK